VRRSLVCAALWLVCACSRLPFPDPKLEGEYGAALKKWTRQVALYSGLETRAFVRVIYLSPEFVQKQAQEISKMRAELPDKAAETLAHLRQEYRQPSFFAVAYMPDRTANDWNEPGSVWRLAVNFGTGERAPDRVLRYESPFNAEMRALYPYIDDYSVCYLIRFPDPLTPPPGTPQPAQSFTPVEVQLIAAGALGKMSFRWRLDGGPETPSSAEPGQEQGPVTSPKLP